MKKPRKVALLGSGPIVIGQASEFDYSGVQAIKALKEEGCSVVVINSNLATIMTDPRLADATYMEPLVPDYVVPILEKERPDALINTLGGQTGLNLSMELARAGVLKKLGITLMGADTEAIKRAEDRNEFKRCAERVGLRVPDSVSVSSVKQGLDVLENMGYPGVIRPFFTLGGAGGSVVRNRAEARRLLTQGLRVSPVGQCLVERSLLGWREFELEVVVDRVGNAMVVCSIENIDPMGVHTGDSITVAPALTLDDGSYQNLRDGALALVKAIGMRTGGCNVQFAVNPRDPSDIYVIEVNPRVSRSSALASKATGFPIAWAAVKMALGYTLPEIRLKGLDVPGSFEPALDYLAVKLPRFDLEKFPGAQRDLSVQMKSVGEVMALGRCFPEALQKAIRSLETGHTGLNSLAEAWMRERDMGPQEVKSRIRDMLLHPNPQRIFAVADALRWGFRPGTISRLTGIHPFFIGEIARIVRMEDRLVAKAVGRITRQDLAKAKALGFSDRRLSELLNISPGAAKRLRDHWGISPGFLTVDTCAGEHPTTTSYHYSTYWSREREPKPLGRKAVLILGAGPARIGQSLEFDYSSVQAIQGARDEGYLSVMLNCNPETVSTDQDVSDRLYFEPVETESVLDVLEHENCLGVMVQFGGQTPLNMARAIRDAGGRVLGTQPEVIESTEDRKKFWSLLDRLGISRPTAETGFTPEEIMAGAEKIGYPLLLRPSYVIGGRRMRVVWNRDQLEEVARSLLSGSRGPVSLDRFFLDAREYDVEVLSDGKHVYVAGIIEHIQEAGVHSGDSSGIWPPVLTPRGVISEIEEISRTLVENLEIVGLANIQFAWHGENIYVLELNPRASRTVPFLSKATGVALARLAARVMLGKPLPGLLKEKSPWSGFFFVKEPVFSFPRLPGSHVLLGPEMRSTGEAAGLSPDPHDAVLKGLWASGWRLGNSKNVYLGARDSAKPGLVEVARSALRMGYSLLAPAGTREYLARNGIPSKEVSRKSLGDMILRGEIAAVVDIPEMDELRDAHEIRWKAFLYGIPCFLTLSHARLFWSSVQVSHGTRTPTSLQEVHDVSRS